MSLPVSVTVGDGIAALRFERPERMNVIDVEMAQGFEAAVGRALDDTEVRVITLSGAGRCFMAGGDLGALRAADDKPQMARDIIGPVHRTLVALSESPKVSIAAIHGPVAGAGMSLAMATDLCLAAEGTTLTLAYPKVAVPADCGATWALVRLVGLRRAMELALLSPTIAAADAQAIGLVNRVVPSEVLEAETAGLARKLAAGAPLALGLLKALLRQSLDTPLPGQLDAEEEGFVACAATQDFAEALEAFFGRRAPVFCGR
jgi:2-(1,2-epoxy-1,2-dihydrophenyl)acetyl-CoA isomerase